MSGAGIHTAAHVDPSAEIGEGTTVGPGAVVEAGAVVGRHCEIQAHAVVCSATVLGNSNRVGYGAILGAEPQDVSYRKEFRSRLVVGDDNWIREYATLHRGSGDGAETVVGSGNFLMAGAHVGHDCRVGNRVVIANNCLLGGHVSVGDGAFLGGGSVFHQHIRVGRLAITQGNSGFGKDLPPYMIGSAVNRVSGVNAVGLRRAGFGAEDRSEIKRLHRLFFASGLGVQGALEQTAKEKWGEAAAAFLEFIRTAGKRGICSGLRL